MQGRSLARAAFIVGIAYVLSNLTGLGQRIIVTSRFGTSAEYDAFNAAFRIPDLLFNLLAGGALASAFIPTFTTRLSRNQQALAWRLAESVTGLVFAGMCVIATLAALLAPFIIRIFVAPGFSPEQVDLTAGLMRTMLISTVIFGVSGLLMGVLQSSNSFVAPAIAPSLYNLGIIFGATALSSQGIHGVTQGVVLGSLLHLCVQLPALIRVERRARHLNSQPSGVDTLGQRSTVSTDDTTPAMDLSAQPGAISAATPAPSMEPLVLTNATTGSPMGNIKDTLGTPYAIPNSEYETRSDVSQVIRLMLPRVVGLGAVQLNLIVTTNLASSMGAGAVSALNIAFATLLLPQAAIAQATATVLFPTISAHAARGERKEFAAALTRAINVIIALSVPATMGLILLGQPIIRLLFERNAFSTQSTSDVAFALTWFAVGLVGHSVLEVVTRGFYALQDTSRPVILSVASMVLNVVLSLILSAVFRASGISPFGGLALANSIATVLETVALYILLIRRVPELGARSTLVASIKSTLAAAVMAGVLGMWLRVLGMGTLAALLALVIGMAVYFGVAWLLHSDEARYAAAIVQSRLSRVARAGTS